MKKSCRIILNACSMLGRQLIVAILISTSFIFASSVGTNSVSAAPAGAVGIGGAPGEGHGVVQCGEPVCHLASLAEDSGVKQVDAIQVLR